MYLPGDWVTVRKLKHWPSEHASYSYEQALVLTCFPGTMTHVCFFFKTGQIRSVLVDDIDLIKIESGFLVEAARD